LKLKVSFKVFSL